jgi:hypothetical protein
LILASKQAWSFKLEPGAVNSTLELPASQPGQ